jgi:hypothetical protein
MHRLEITGETPEALYLNVVNTLAMFLRGPSAPVSAAQAVDASEVSVSRTSDVAPPEQEVLPPVKGRRRSTKAAGVPDLGAELGMKPLEEKLNDAIPDLTGGAEKLAKELTLADDIIPRLMAIQAAHTKRGNDMPTVVKYIQKLYGPFGIANAKNLKPEQFAEFLEASEAYLSGEA